MSDPMSAIAACAAELSIALGPAYRVTWDMSTHVIEGRGVLRSASIMVYLDATMECVHDVYSQRGNIEDVVDTVTRGARRWLACGQSLPVTWFAKEVA